MAKQKVTAPVTEKIKKPDGIDVAKGLGDMQNSSLYGISQDFVDKNAKLITDLGVSVKEYLSKSSPSQSIGASTPETLINAVQQTKQEELKKQKKGAKPPKISNVKGIDSQDDDFQLFNELYGIATPAFELFKEYDMLDAMIPEGHRCFEILHSSVLSADNFTKEFLIPEYNETTADKYDTGDDPALKTTKLLSQINDDYQLNKKISNYIQEAMKYGAKPVMFIPIDDNFRDSAKKILKAESTLAINNIIDNEYTDGIDVKMESILQLESSYNEIIVEDENICEHTNKISNETLEFENVVCEMVDELENDVYDESAIPEEAFYDDTAFAIMEGVREKKVNKIRQFKKKANRKKLIKNAAKWVSECVNKNIKYTLATEITTMSEVTKIARNINTLNKQRNRSTRHKNPTNNISMESINTGWVNDEKYFNKVINETVWTLNRKRGDTIRFEDTENLNDDSDENLDSSSINTKDVEVDLEDLHTSGTIIVPLSPDSVVPISVHGEHIGYFVVEKIGSDDLSSGIATNLGYRNSTQGFALGINGAIQSGIGATGGPDGAGVIVKDMIDIPQSTRNNDKRTGLLKKMMVRAVSERIGNPDIVNDKAFNALLYSLIKDDYITNKEIRITYVPEHMMVYFAHELDKDTGIGVSIYNKGLFFGHVYIATLITNLMISISRSMDREQFNVELGMDNKRIEATVNKVMRQLQTKRVSIDAINSVDTIMKSIGTFQRYISVRNNGNPMIEMETIPGQNVDLDNSLQEKALHSYINSFSVPHSMLNMLSQDEYSRSVAVNSAMMLRKVISLQHPYQECASKALKILTRNKYPYKILTLKNTKKIEELNKTNQASQPDNPNRSTLDLIDLTKVKNRLPEPQGLYTNNTNELVSNASTFIQNIIDYLIPTDIKDDDQEAFKNIMSYELLKIYVPSMPYDDFEKLQKQCKKALQVKQLKNDGAKGDDFGGGDSGGGGDTGGDDFGGGDDTGGGDSGGGDDFSLDF